MTVFPLAVSILRSFDWRFYCSKINFFSKFQLSGQNREMEDFRGIAEESFPSFLTNSLFGNSGILENVTLSSNLGLPVAVSTLARNRSSTDNRYPDVQSSYLVEERFSVPSGSSPESQSDAEPRERLQLSFQDDDSISRKKSYVESQRLSNALSKQSASQMETAGPEEEPAGATESLQDQDLFNRASPLEQAQDSPIDFHLQSWMNDKEPKIVVLDAGKYFEDKTLNSDLSHTSLLEDEKLVLPTSLEDSSDDDIDDEMFYDDHLEAYFEQLAVPGMIYEDLEGPEPPEKGFKLPTNDLSQANENGSLNCKFQSENNSSLISLDLHSSETTRKESEESQVFCLPGTSNSVGAGGSRRHTGGLLPFSSGTWGIEKEIENVKGIVPDLSSESTSKDVLVKTLRATDLKLNSDNFHDASANRGGFDPTDPVKQGVECPHQNKTVLHMDGCLDTETPTVSIQEDVDVASLKPISDSGINFSDALWSPTCERRTCECHESIEKNKDKTDLPQSVVYQNEEGRWVTDLAYYTSFNSKQNLNMSLSDEMNEDFRSGSEAFDLIAQDEEEFNKEHQFIQEENIDAHNASVALGDMSWGATINHSLLRKSHSTSDLDKDDASYLRLSLGEFFAQRSEALGCLGGGNNVKRPSFGYFIRSPEKTEPIALIRKSDVSRGDLEKEMAHLNHDLYSGDLNEQSQAQLSEGSITLQVEAVERTSQVDENDVTLMADKGKTEDTFFMSNTPQRYKDKLPDSGDSVLRISTIASAIAEASVNTDPSQLAAMIKALSNKTRDKTFQEDEKQKDCSHVCHFLAYDLEKSNGSNVFDMEKYLKKTEVSRYESALENFSRTGMSDTWDLSLPKEQITQDIHTVDLSATSVSVREPEENTAAIVYVENGESESQESSRTVNSSNSVTNVRENSSAVVDVKTRSIDDKLQDVGNNEKTTSVSTPSDSYSSVRNSRITSLCLLKECEEIRDSRENQRQNECVSEISNSEKHVTFKNHCIVSPKNSDLKNLSPEHGGRGSEDEQESFRPSTSPLSHSSPSEISGTSSSGCALESFGSAAQQQQPPCKQELSPLACSPAGVSRLTYVSEPESSCPATTTDDALEDRKSDITSELSTTIIQGSPAALEERAMEKLREKVPFQNRGKGTLSSIIQNNSDTRKATETTSLSSKAESVKPDFKWSKDPSSKSGNLLETNEVGLTSNPEEVDLIRLALLGKSGLSCQVGSATSRPVSCQEPVDEDQRIIPKDKSTAGRESGGQVSHQTTSENQCTPVPSSTVRGSVADVQDVPAAVHALLAQPPLSTAPFAQRYLGTLPSAGSTTLPQCHAGSATVCGFSGGLPYPAVAGEPVQSSLAMGICLGSNIGSGWTGPSSLCNPYSNTLNQNLLSTTKPFPVPSVGTNCGIEPWDSGVTSGLGSVRVPEELKLPHACCVGIASQTLLSVLNPTDRWLQVSIGVLSISVNGEKVDLSTYRCLVFKNKAIIRPHTTEEIKVLFIPSSPGVFRCTFSVASWPCSTDAETIVQAEALASTVTLTAIAESPVIEIPLSGYGGTSNLILEGVKKLSDSYMVTVNGLVPGKESKIVFSVRNTGSRAAFVKAVGFKDSQKKILLDPKVLRIFPDKFVLKERTQEDVTLIYNPSDRGINNKTATELSTVYLFGGDEISRQQYRRALLHKPEMIKEILPEHSVFQNINFVEAFQDELLVTEVYDIPQRPNDVQLFYGSMCKIILSVIGEFRDCISSREFLQPSSKASLESTSDLEASGRHGGNISLDVLPVKGPQGSPLLSQAARPPPDQLASGEPWTVLPEHLILVAPSPCDMAKTGHFQIVNNSVRLLRFELCWPAHCLTVTPQHGCVAPESKLQILVSPNSSLSTKQSMFPWSGLIYIHCDAGQKKIVKVQIREDLTQVELLTRLTSKPFGILSPISEPAVSHLVKPMTKPPSTKVEIRKKSITFSTTEPGETSESCLELENHGTTDVKWHLSSLAPPYVKGVDESGDVFRATYAAFRCSPISGLLESHGIQKVSITFLPRGRGDYAQFWDVECHPLKEPHMKHTLRFQLSGQSIEAENEPENAPLSTDSLVKIDHLVKPRRQAVSEASARIPDRQLDVTARGVYAPEDVYRFLPTSVGESRTLKVNLRNNSFITHSLKFLSPREPFYVKHSKYSLRAQHYINMPVQFKPKSAGKFEALLVIQTDEGKSIAIRLMGEALGKN
uniref:centrosomal protein of 192 kDa isoform X8 n=1 Tax=Macaca mulatta TaxID=9544 RepID=UPI0010A26A34|nr:centrosomal protein of 192 kDa isoform X8 [Macaca mulatta]